MSLLEIRGLRIEFPGRTGPQVAVRGVNLTVEEGEVVGLVGESGSGKSLTCRSVVRMLPPAATIGGGSLAVAGQDVLAMSPRQLRQLRANTVGMIYQNPFGSLNPVIRVGAQIAETLRVNRGLGRAEAKRTAISLLERVGLDKPAQRARAYPHELSGGMCQRIMIALATASRPRLMLADEPTTALDVATQAQILDLLEEMRAEQAMAMVLVSHDFGVIAQACDRVVVMYGGRVVEVADVDTVYRHAEHPYTRALLDSVPEITAGGIARRGTTLHGHPPEPSEAITGCNFAPRCEYTTPTCLENGPSLLRIDASHSVACSVRPFAGSARALAGGSQHAVPTEVSHE